MSKSQSVWAVIFCPETERFLIARRGPKVNRPGEWNLFGGGVEKGEKRLKSMTRELKEEGGFRVGKSELSPISRFRFDKDSDDTHVMTFYLLKVEKEIIPKLNSESDKYKWASIKQMPQPRHKSLSVFLTFVHKRMMKRLESEKNFPAKEAASDFQVVFPKDGVARLEMRKHGLVAASVDYISASNRLVNCNVSKIARGDGSTARMIEHATSLFPVKDIAIEHMSSDFLSSLGFVRRSDTKKSGLMEFRNA